MKILMMLLVAILMSTSLFAESATSAQVQNIKNFSYQGVTLGMSSLKFLHDFPWAVVDEGSSDDSSDVVVYDYVPSAKGLSGVQFCFFKNKLFVVIFMYTQDAVYLDGGRSAIFNRLVENFGFPTPPASPTKDNPHPRMFWYFPKIDRRIILHASGDGDMTVAFAVPSGIDALARLRASKASIGF